MFHSTAEALAARYQALGMLQTRPLTPTAAPSATAATTSISATTTAVPAASTPADRLQTVQTPRGIGGLPLQTVTAPVTRSKPTAPLGASG